MHRFYAHRSQKRKKRQSSHQSLFVLLGSACTKAACKTLVKSNLGEVKEKPQVEQVGLRQSIRQLETKLIKNLIIV